MRNFFGRRKKESRAVNSENLPIDYHQSRLSNRGDIEDDSATADGLNSQSFNQLKTPKHRPNKVIGRVYFVAPSGGESFYLRMFLTATRGPWKEYNYNGNEEQ